MPNHPTFPLSTHQIGERLGVTHRTVVDLVRSGRLRAIRVGRSFRFSEIDLADFLERAAYQPAPKTADPFEPAPEPADPVEYEFTQPIG